MEISAVQQITAMKEQGISPIYSIWIVHEKQDDDTYDVNVWDEIEQERDDALEESRFPTFEEAEDALNRIINDNPDITFVQLAVVTN